MYLYKYHYKLRDKPSAEKLAVFKRGHDFGRLAHDLFPGGKDVSPPSPRAYMQSVNATQHLIQEGFPVIYEAAFRDDAVLVYLDILVKKEDGFHAYEVKSSRRISQTYIQDAAIQNHIIKLTGIDLVDFSIVHVREDYDPERHSTAEDIFVFQSISEEIEPMRDFVQKTIDQAQSTLMLDEIPEIETGPHCDIPYECDFKGLCFGRIERE